MPTLKIVTDKRVCFWGAPTGTIPGEADFARQFAQTGYNTGNMMIGNGLFNATESVVKQYHPGFGVLSPAEFDECFDVVFIPASNFVRNGEDLQAQYDYFSKTKAQFFMFGLGSQVSADEPISLQPGTDKFLRLVAERSGSIGVRGAGTAELLLSLGIHNVDIVGCPSLMDFPNNLTSRRISSVQAETRIATNYSNNVRRHSFCATNFADIESLVFKAFMRPNSFYILQNEASEMEILQHHGESEHADSVAAAVQQASRQFGVDCESAEVRRFFNFNMRMFFDVQAWISCLRTMDFSIGSRFHGNVAALLAGIPAFFIAHDNRTLELCEFFSLPHVKVNSRYSPLSVEEMIELTDYDDFFARLPLVFAHWKTYLARNNLAFRSY
jgi:hypothetical protein